MKTKKSEIGIYDLLKKEKTLGQKAADSLTKFAGSWTFIFLLTIFMGLWIWLNVSAYFYHWDPWPFIILNLCLSCLAAIQAPIILMSQNRQAEKDRIKADWDYRINKKAEKEIEEIIRYLRRIERKLDKSR